MLKKSFAGLAAAALMATAPSAALAAPGDQGKASPEQGCAAVLENAGTGMENAAGTPSAEKTAVVFFGLCA